MPAFDQRLNFLIGKLDQKFLGIDKQFVDQMIEKSKEMNYQQRVVVNEDDDDEVDEGNEDDEEDN